MSKSPNQIGLKRFTPGDDGGPCWSRAAHQSTEEDREVEKVFSRGCASLRLFRYSAEGVCQALKTKARQIAATGVAAEARSDTFATLLSLARRQDAERETTRGRPQKISENVSPFCGSTVCRSVIRVRNEYQMVCARCVWTHRAALSTTGASYMTKRGDLTACQVRLPSPPSSGCTCAAASQPPPGSGSSRRERRARRRLATGAARRRPQPHRLHQFL